MTLLSNSVSVYPFNSDALDAKASNDLTPSGVTYAAGKLGNAAVFNGSAYASGGNVHDFDGTAAFSVSAWIKTSADTQDIVSKGLSGSPYTGWAFLVHSDGTILAQIINTATTNTIEVSGSTDVTDDAWRLVTFTYDGSQTAAGIKLYVNGVLETPTVNYDVLTGSSTNVANFSVGSRNNSAIFFTGSIDQVIIYNTELTQTEITTLNNSGSGIAYPFDYLVDIPDIISAGSFSGISAHISATVPDVTSTGIFSAPAFITGYPVTVPDVISSGAFVAPTGLIGAVIPDVVSSGAFTAPTFKIRAFNLLSVKTSLGTDNQQNIRCGIADCGLQNILVQLGFSAVGLQNLRSIISGDSVLGLQNIRTVIEEYAYAIGLLNVRAQIKDITPVINDIGSDNRNFKFYLDGREINSYMDKASISYSESSFHNTVSISSLKSELFDWSNPQTLKGTSRIEAQITEGGTTRAMYFLVEKRPGARNSFSIWGRDITARENSPYAEKVTTSITTPQLASEIAAGLCQYSSLTWEADDYVVYEWEYYGNPIDGISELASEIGAIVRANDDGSLTVRYKRKVRPVLVDEYTPDISFTDSDTSVSGFSFEHGTGANQITIVGRQQDIWTPTMSIEESSPIKGSDVHIRAYWEGHVPSIITKYTTEGLIKLLGTFQETIQAEQVVFENGVGSTSYPIKSISSVSWYSTNNGSVTADPYAKTVVAENEIFGIADITYVTDYQRYRVYGHYIDALLAVFIFATLPSVNALIKTVEDDIVDLGTITASLLSSSSAAIARGKVEIDEVRYDKYSASFITPYTSDAIDGAVAAINNAHIGKEGNYYVQNVESVFSITEMSNNIQVIKCL